MVIAVAKKAAKRTPMDGPPEINPSCDSVGDHLPVSNFLNF
jgi:hypothetical protein